MDLIGVLLHVLAFALLLGGLALLWDSLTGARADLQELGRLDARHDKR